MKDNQIERISNKSDKVDEKQKKINNFSDLLDNIETMENKKKHLWKEIYENALEDREKAKLLYNDIYINIGGGLNDHMNIGSVAAKYLERMSKSNDQILKLVELISKEEEKSEAISDDDIFNKIL